MPDLKNLYELKPNLNGAEYDNLISTLIFFSGLTYKLIDPLVRYCHYVNLHSVEVTERQAYTHLVRLVRYEKLSILQIYMTLDISLERLTNKRQAL